MQLATAYWSFFLLSSDPALGVSRLTRSSLEQQPPTVLGRNHANQIGAPHRGRHLTCAWHSHCRCLKNILSFEASIPKASTPRTQNSARRPRALPKAVSCRLQKVAKVRTICDGGSEGLRLFWLPRHSVSQTRGSFQHALALQPTRGVHLLRGGGGSALRGIGDGSS